LERSRPEISGLIDRAGVYFIGCGAVYAGGPGKVIRNGVGVRATPVIRNGVGVRATPGSLAACERRSLPGQSQHVLHVVEPGRLRR
jgi:hypothetical protein